MPKMDALPDWQYIADQITKLERSGYMDKATQSNFWMLADMLKEIRKYCHDAALDRQEKP